MRIRKNGKVINLTESDLTRIVRRVISEQEIKPIDFPSSIGKFEDETDFRANDDAPEIQKRFYVMWLDSSKRRMHNPNFDVETIDGGKTWEVSWGNSQGISKRGKEIIEKCIKYGGLPNGTYNRKEFGHRFVNKLIPWLENQTFDEIPETDPWS